MIWLYVLIRYVWISYHYSDVIMDAMVSHITSLYSTVYTGANQRKHQSSVPLAFVRGIHRSPVNSPHKCPVTRKKFPFDDVIMVFILWGIHCNEMYSVNQPQGKGFDDPASTLGMGSFVEGVTCNNDDNISENDNDNNDNDSNNDNNIK